MNLTKQVTFILAIFITVTSVTAIVPAYLIIRSELMAQADQRLIDALHHSQMLMQAEQRQVESIVQLAAKRPTLQRLIQQEGADALHRYLAVFQADTPLDYLYVQDADGQLLAGDKIEAGQLALSATVQVDTLGAVTGGILLDAAFAGQLQQQTGFIYRFLVDDALITPVDATMQTQGGLFYHDRLALYPTVDHPTAALEVALPIEGLLASEGHVIGVLLLSTLAVAVVVSLGGGLYVRNRIRPLWKLTAAAKRMGAGDLNTPIDTPSKMLEVSTLAQVLEDSRVRIRQSLRALSRQKEWSEALIQSVTEGIVTLDAAGKVVFFSEGAARIARKSQSEAIGQHVNTLFNLSDGGDLMDFIPPEGGARRSVLMDAADHGQITVAITRARQAEEGQTTIVLHDVTEEMQRRNVQAYFLAHMSHEFRTPLAGMKVSVELLLENIRYLSAAELDELLKSLYLSISSLQNLIDNLLESGKIESSHFSLRRQQIQLNHVLSDALRLVQPFLNRRNQSLTLEQPLTLPLLVADSTRLAQVIVNLLANASKYSPMDSTIDLLVDVRSPRLYFAVADRGQGVPYADRENIFRQFVRSEGSTTAEYSSGLGLAVVKAIIEAHGGQVGVDAREGGGSVFWFTIPIV